MELTNIEKLLKTPMAELKYHELQQLEEHLKAANEKVEAVAKQQKERGAVFPYEILGKKLYVIVSDQDQEPIQIWILTCRWFLTVGILPGSWWA
uniref:Uncharacterized protein n=1 Tax=Solanum lycopersicum TaxID=4081 RepID=A0A3Q7HD31_SOLLC